jgi:hypothetical protein
MQKPNMIERVLNRFGYIKKTDSLNGLVARMSFFFLNKEGEYLPCYISKEDIKLSLEILENEIKEGRHPKIDYYSSFLSQKKIVPIDGGEHWVFQNIGEKANCLAHPLMSNA